jgi:flagellar biosynthesis protein FlhF
MKIKRFEAPNMAEALRMIRKEFGEEAVILSAKNTKNPGRIFGLKSGGQVVVTAAIDPTGVKNAPANENQASFPAADEERRNPAQEGPKPTEGIERILKQYTPITRTGQQKLQPRFVRWMSASQEQTGSQNSDCPNQSVYETMLAQGLAKGIAAELAGQAPELMNSDDLTDLEQATVLAQLIEAKGWVAPVKNDHDATPRIIVLVGANGVGKTTMAAKLAARHLLRSGEKTAVISLDDQRIAGTAELARYAGIMGLPFETASDPTHLSRLMGRMADAQLVVVDTPGLNPQELSRRDALAHMIKALEDPEVHLLISAATQETVIAKNVALFRPLGIHRLLPTHLDWSDRAGPFINQMALAHLPIGYLSTGPQVPEGVRALTARDMAALLLAQEYSQEEEERETAAPITIVQRRAPAAPEAPYVANRNSDIFHDRTCKSVGRISNDNALVFKDPTEAMNKGFKPCRMCCMALLVPKPIDRLARSRYAGSRN